MHKSIEERIYLIAAIETLIYGNEKTTIGNYSLEFNVKPCNYTHHASLGFFVNIRDNLTDEVIWHQLFIKPLTKDKDDYLYTISRIVPALYEGTTEEKAAFIFNNEGIFKRRPYLQSPDVEYTYLDELEEEPQEPIQRLLSKNILFLIKQHSIDLSLSLQERLIKSTIRNLATRLEKTFNLKEK